ncbi:MAG: CdaR family protein [Acidobacteria bacterium]|nr:CdaR family protein [Acidobacteriota bacterium]
MSDARSPWGLRLLALALAGLAWFTFSGEKREPLSEKLIEASVRYDTPRNYLLLEREETVRVTARGPLSKIRSLTAPLVDVWVKLPEEEGELQVALGEDHVILPEGLELVSVVPNVIKVRLDTHTTRFVPVVADLQGEPAAGARVLSSRVMPNTVFVAGPASRVAALEQVMTLPIDLAGHARDFEEEVAVRPPEPLISIQEPQIVNVIVQLAIPNVEPNEETAPPFRH